MSAFAVVSAGSPFNGVDSVLRHGVTDPAQRLWRQVQQLVQHSLGVLRGVKRGHSHSREHGAREVWCLEIDRQTRYL